MSGASPAVVLRRAAARLADAGVESPDHDASTLLAHVLGTSRSGLLARTEVGASDTERFDALVTRRCRREPLQHLTGFAGFRHVQLAVGPGVFVPRPETELLAGWAVQTCLELLGDRGGDGGGERRGERGGELGGERGGERGADGVAGSRRPVVVDLCTGSGAIALAVATEVPQAEVHAVELDEVAVGWAARNLAGSGVDLRRGDMAAAFPELDGAVDVVVSNPPYIPLGAWESVAVEVRDHDPALALFSGEDGLDALRTVERTAARLLCPGGVVGAEHADLQRESAPAVFSGTGRWVEVRDHRDLAGRPRFLTARLAR